jgi:hypothetical protein
LNRNPLMFAAIAAVASLQALPTIAKQPLETETARLPAKGHGDIQFEFEYATSSESNDIAMPIVFEYGISDRLKFVVEPDVYASIKPKGGGSSASGFGDTEAKLVYLVSEETDSTPAFAIAGEIKIPTGKKPDLGSGKVDYRAFGVVSKRVGAFDLHANLGYTLVGSPAGEKLANVVDYSAAAEYEVNKSFTLVSEILGASELGGGGGAEVPGGAETEAAGTTITGLIGGIFHISPKTQFAIAATYDSGSAFLIRAGLTYSF